MKPKSPAAPRPVKERLLPIREGVPIRLIRGKSFNETLYVLSDELGQPHRRRELNALRKLVATTLWSCTDENDAWPTPTEMAGWFHCTERTIRKAMKDLEASGIIVPLKPAETRPTEPASEADPPVEDEPPIDPP